MIDLYKFCAGNFRAYSRQNLVNPFWFEDKLIATDAHIMVWLPLTPKQKAKYNRGIIGNLKYVLGMFRYGPWLRLPGWKRFQTSVPFGVVELNVDYLRLIKTELPNPKLSKPLNKYDPVSIKFDGGNGLLMPMRA